VAIPIAAFVWSYFYMMAGDCPGLDDSDLKTFVAQKNNAGYVALSVCALVYGALVMIIRRRGQR
jgi:uncharacterized membrane protein